MVRVHEKTESEAVEALKRAALKLFAERGVDGVTVREIATAAGQKNHGAVGYHFSSKLDLIRALVIEGAQLIDERRNAALDRLEASGRDVRLRDIVSVLIFPAIDLAAETQEECFNRFVVLFSMTYRGEFMATVEGRWNTGFQRCLAYLRGWMDHLTRQQQTERLIFIESYLGSVLAARETRLADATRPHATWSTPATLQHFALTIEAIVRAPAPMPDAECREPDETGRPDNV